MPITVNSVEFSGPLGGPLRDPSEDFLKSILHEPSVDYWRSGSADAALNFSGPDGWAQLDFTYHPGLGFCVVFESPSEQLVLTTNPNDDEIVSVWFIQNQVEMPRSHFVPPNVALAAALAFLPSGAAGQVAGGGWIPFSPLEP